MTSQAIVSEQEVREKEKDLHNATNDNVTFLNRLLDSIKALQGQIQELQGQLSAEQGKVAQLENDKTGLQATIASLEEVKKQNEGTIQEMGKKIEELTAELEKDKGEIYRQMQERDDQIVSLSEEIGKQKKEIGSLQHLTSQVDSFHIGQNQLKEPSHACVLPDESVVVTDVEQGILIFSKYAELMQTEKSGEWKWPQGLAYDEQAGHLYVSLIRKPGSAQGEPKTPLSPSAWVRGIGVFDLKLQAVKFVDGPQNTGFENVAKENLAICKKSGELYFSLADNLGSALYKIGLKDVEDKPGESVEKLWQEITNRTGVNFADFQIMPSPGPMTDVLIVETRKSYLYRWCIKDKMVCGTFNYAPVQKPSAIAVDERGLIFIHDTASGKIYLLDSFSFDTQRDVCSIDNPVSSITAHHGCLGVALRSAKQVIIYKYSDESLTPSSAKHFGF